MSTQPSFSFADEVNIVIPQTLPAPATGTIAERFRAFHKANPLVYEIALGIALRLKRKGIKRCSMDAIFHHIRWQYFIQVSGVEKFKLNNNFTAHYARLLMEQEPELAGWFEVRG